MLGRQDHAGGAVDGIDARGEDADRLARFIRVNGDQVEVGPRFSVNSELRRFLPRDPGELLDGIGQDPSHPSRPGAQI